MDLFLFPVDFVCYVSSSLYKVNFGFSTEALEHSCFKQKKSLLHYLKNKKKYELSQAVQYVAFNGNDQHCTVGSLIILILNVF